MADRERRRSVDGPTGVDRSGLTYEAAILVRIDNMTTFQTEGQRSIRFTLKEGGVSVNDQVDAALKQAPPVDKWQGF